MVTARTNLGKYNQKKKKKKGTPVSYRTEYVENIFKFACANVLLLEISSSSLKAA